MSFDTAKYIDCVDKKGPLFSGGIVDNVQPHLLSWKNTPSAKNFRTDGYGTLIRPGFYQFGDTFTGISLGTAPFGIASYLRAVPANDRIVVGMRTVGTDGVADAGNKYLISIDEDGAETAITTGVNVTVQTRMNFVNIGDSLYCMNGTNGLGKLDGTTYTLANALTFKFGIYFNGSLWASGNASAPQKLYKSITDTPGTFTGPDSDELTFNEEILGIAGCNTVVYVFTANTLSYLNSQTIRDVGGTLVYSSMPLDTNGGVVNHNCIVTVGKHVYYLSKANKVKRVAPGSVTGFDVEDVSHRLYNGIEKIMEGLDYDQSDASAYYDQDAELIKWHVRSKGSTYNDLVICYHTMYDQFFVDTNKNFNGGVFWHKKSYTISQLEPKIFLDEQGATDDDAPIQFEYWSKVIDLGGPYLLKELWQTRTYMQINQLASVVQEIYADGSLIDTRTITSADIPIDVDGIGTLETGTFAIGEEGTISDNLFDVYIVREKGHLQRRAKKFQFRWKASKLGSRCLLNNLLPRFEVLPQDTFKLT